MTNHTQTVCFYLLAQEVSLGQHKKATGPARPDDRRRLHSVTMRLDSGTITVLMGPNGAGKSTLLSVLAGRLLPDSGILTLCERTAVGKHVSNTLAIRDVPCWSRHIGYMPERLPEFSRMRVREVLSNACYMKTGRVDFQRIQQVLDWCDLEEHAEQLVGTLSLGYRQRLNLARALVHRPKVLLLDEPMNGLDPHHASEFGRILSRLKDRLVILMTTHVLSGAVNWCDRILVMRDGCLLGEINPAVSSPSTTVVAGHWRLRFLHPITPAVRTEVASRCPVHKSTEKTLEITSNPQLNAELLARLAKKAQVCELSPLSQAAKTTALTGVWEKYQALLESGENTPENGP